MELRQVPVILRIAIVVLALAVFVCLALPMTQADAGMSIGLMCCFVLAILLGAFLLGRPQRTLVLLARGIARPPRPPAVIATARAPDPVALGSLLI